MPSPRRNRPFRGWRMVGVAATIQFVQSGMLLNVFSDYADALKDQFGWSRTTLSAAFAMNRAESGLLGPAQGWAVDRYGPRRIIYLGAAMWGVGWIWLSQIDGLTGFFGAFFVVAVGASLSGFLTLTTVLVNWFQRRRATALSLSGVGIAAGGLLVPGVAWFLANHGWRPAAFITGVVGVAVVVPLARMIVHRPSDVGEEVDGGAPPEGSAPSRIHVTAVDFTATEALRTRAFWMISFGHASALLVVSAVLAHRAIYLTDDRGWTTVASGLVGGGIVVMQFIGQLVGGFLGDRIDKRFIAGTAMFGHMIGLLLFAHGSAAWMILLFIPLHGLAWGARGPLMQALRADYFGPSSFGTIMGFSSMIVMFGMMGGGLFAGVTADALGSYTPGFTILALVSGAGGVFFWTLKPPPPPVRQVVSDATVASSDDSTAPGERETSNPR